MGATLFIQPIRRCEDGIWGATMGNQLSFPPVSSTWLSELLQSHPRGKLKSKRERWSWPQHTHRNETSAALLVRTVELTWCHGACGAGTGGQSEKSSGCSLCTGRAWCLCACGNGEWAHLSEQISRSSHPRCIYKASLLKGGRWKKQGESEMFGHGKDNRGHKLLSRLWSKGEAITLKIGSASTLQKCSGEAKAADAGSNRSLLESWLYYIPAVWPEISNFSLAGSLFNHL